MKTPASTRALPRIFLAATGILALGASQSTAQLVAKPLACDESGGVVDLTMEIRDLSVLGTTPSGINGLVLQRSRDLIGWTTAHPAEVSIDPPTGLYPPLGGRWTAGVSSPAGSGFFRFLGVVTTAQDLDGDGLADGFESGVFPFTDPSLFDSDFDSFSDGQEFAYGSDPNSSSSKPVSIDSPTVGFVALHSTAVEGGGVHWLPIAFDRHFDGLLNYAVDPLGNTSAGTDFTLGGVPTATIASISVNGSTAAIPITILDNSQVSGQRAMIVHLRLNGNSYIVGGGASHVVLLEDDDAWWTGTLIPASGEISSRSFRLAIRHDGATSVVFGAGAGNDGLPVPEVEAGGGAPAIGNTSISATLVPSGQWTATGAVDSATRFHALSPPMPVPCGSLLGGQTILRQLELNAEPALQSDTQPHLLESNRMVGAYTETLASSTGAPLAAFSGTFILIRDIPTPLPVVSALFPEPP